MVAVVVTVVALTTAVMIAPITTTPTNAPIAIAAITPTLRVEDDDDDDDVMFVLPVDDDDDDDDDEVSLSEPVDGPDTSTPEEPLVSTGPVDEANTSVTDDDVGPDEDS